ncbi:MAG: hypothetical protein GY711_35125 [bacterium]|nr:hypothetical protein [bacterium]
MSLTPILFVSGLVGLGGYLVAAKKQGSEDSRERKRLARQMKTRVDEHYATYLDLEERVKRVIDQFDRLEEETQGRIAEKDNRIAQLTREMKTSLSDTQARTRSELAQATIRIAELQEEKRVEIDDQSQRVEELQVEIARLHDEHQAEMERVRASREDSQNTQNTEVDRLERRVAELEPQAAELTTTRERADELQRQVDAVQSELEAERAQNAAAAFEADAGDDEGFGSLTDLCDDPEVEQFAPLENQLESSDERLQELMVRCDTAEARLAEERELHAESVRELRSSLAASETRAHTAQAEVDAAVSRAEVAEDRVSAAEHQVTTLSQQVEAAQNASRTIFDREEGMRERNEELEAELAKRQDELNEELESLRAIHAEDAERLRVESERAVAEHEAKQEELRQRIVELEPAAEEIGGLRDRCTKLERNAKRNATRAKNLETELAEREDAIRELGADPKVVAAERDARQKLLQECASEIDELASESDRQDEQLTRLEAFALEREQSLTEEVDALTGISNELTPLFDSVESLIDSLKGTRERVTDLESEAAEARAEHAFEQASMTELLRVAEENTLSAEDMERHETVMGELQQRYEDALAEKEKEITRLEQCVADLEPLKDAVDDLSKTLEEKPKAKRKTKAKPKSTTGRKKS